MIYMVLWTGGYEPTGIAIKRTKEEAEAHAADWAVDADEGDSVEIYMIDPENLTLAGVKW